MFQRIKGAIDRTIAEEQARQKTLSDSSTTHSRSASASAPARRRPSSKNSPLQMPEAASNPDPAVFEAAFVIDDSDEASRSATPGPQVPEKDTHSPGLKNGADGKRQALAGSPVGKAETKSITKDGGDKPYAPSLASSATVVDPTPEIRVRLRKLEKLEATYPELLRSYRVAHKRATAIEPFEKALRENTPLTSIGDPDALIEYLNQLNLRGDMVMEELRKLSAEKEELKKSHDETQDKLEAARKQLESRDLLSAADKGVSDDGEMSLVPDARIISETAARETVQTPVSSAVASAKASKREDEMGSNKDRADVSEDLFSYDEEIPKLQADVADKNNEIDSLHSEVEKLKGDVALAQESSSGLTKDLENATSQLHELREVSKSKDSLEKQLKEREEEVGRLEAQLEGVQAELKKLEAKGGQSTPSIQAPPGAAPKKRKNRKKGKAIGAGGANFVQAAEEDTSESTVKADVSPSLAIDNGTLNQEVSELKREMAAKDDEIKRLEMKRKSQEDLREEIETLRENLVNIGQDHVEAKNKIKELEDDKLTLKRRIAELEAQPDSAEASTAAVGNAMQSELEALQKEFDSLKAESASMQSDLGAAQQLAQSRFKDLTDLREVLQRAQPELKNLRQESADLKQTKETLSEKVKQLKALEQAEKEAKREASRWQHLASDRGAAIKALEEKFQKESASRQKLEDDKGVVDSNMRRAEANVAGLNARADKAEAEFRSARDEVNKLRPQVKELEQQVVKLRREKAAALEEAEFRTQQYTNAQALLNSLRDQTVELSTQIKEAGSRADALEEELTEVQRLLQERTREGETMRRLLADVDERADSKIREMRGRMEAAIEERDRIEDESSALGRRRAREAEELKQKIRDLERDVKGLGHERDQLEQQQREWKRRRDDLEAMESKVETEAEEMRRTTTELRTALDASEQQVRDSERQRAELRKMVDDWRRRHEVLAKDLRMAQSKLSPPRSSLDSNRSAGASNGSSDLLYLKTILLQFLEQKDGKLRAQLVPVLGKLLRFDKTEEQKWRDAVEHLEVH